jgi:hypothetical protein
MGRRAGVALVVGIAVAAACIAGVTALFRHRGITPRAEAVTVTTAAPTTVTSPVTVTTEASLRPVVVATGADAASIQSGLRLLERIGFRFPNDDFPLLEVTIFSCPKRPRNCRDNRRQEADASAQLDHVAISTCTVVMDVRDIRQGAVQEGLRVDHWFTAVLAHELSHCAGDDREDEAVRRGELWVGRRLGDQAVLRRAKSELTEIDANGNWKE